LPRAHDSPLVSAHCARAIPRPRRCCSRRRVKKLL
jgi:hypothetical protein